MQDLNPAISRYFDNMLHPPIPSSEKSRYAFWEAFSLMYYIDGSVNRSGVGFFHEHILAAGQPVWGPNDRMFRFPNSWLHQGPSHGRDIINEATTNGFMVVQPTESWSCLGVELDGQVTVDESSLSFLAFNS